MLSCACYYLSLMPSSYQIPSVTRALLSEIGTFFRPSVRNGRLVTHPY